MNNDKISEIIQEHKKITNEICGELMKVGYEITENAGIQLIQSMSELNDFLKLIEKQQENFVKGIKKINETNKKLVELIKPKETPTVPLGDRYVCPNDGEPY